MLQAIDPRVARKLPTSSHCAGHVAIIRYSHTLGCVWKPLDCETMRYWRLVFEYRSILATVRIRDEGTRSYVAIWGISDQRLALRTETDINSVDQSEWNFVCLSAMISQRGHGHGGVRGVVFFLPGSLATRDARGVLSSFSDRVFSKIGAEGWRQRALTCTLLGRHFVYQTHVSLVSIASFLASRCSFGKSGCSVLCCAYADMTSWLLWWWSIMQHARVSRNRRAHPPEPTNCHHARDDGMLLIRSTFLSIYTTLSL